MKALVLITLALGILVVSLTVEAQQPGKVSRIGVLYPGSPAVIAPQLIVVSTPPLNKTFEHI